MKRRPDDPFLPAEAASSLRSARRYAVPRWMVERATERRLAGDWRGALAVSGFDVAFDPAQVAAEHGRAVAAALVSDLQHLAPDLVRWHLPRVLGGRSTVATDRTVVLAGYRTGGGLPLSPYLHLRTPPMVDGPQRLALRFGGVPGETSPGVFGSGTEDWRAARYVWDARRTDELRGAAGAGEWIPFLHDDGTPLTPRELGPSGRGDAAERAERVTLLHQDGKVAEAFAAAGVDWDPTPPESERSWYRVNPEEVVAWSAVDIARLEAGVRRATAATGRERFLIGAHWRGHVLLELTDHSAGGRLRARVVEPGTVPAAAFLPQVVWHRLPDLDLLRAGAMPAKWLHPLVARALFPGLEGPFGPPDPSAPSPVRVRCRGEWHEVVFRDGALRSPHTEEERNRESAMRAFGGAVSGCFAVEHSCTSGTGRLPKALRAQRQELFLRVQHGDTPGVLELLDAGVDVHVRDGRRRGLLHVLHLLDHEELLPRLLAAGLDLEALDHHDRTPLGVVVSEAGSPALVRALLDAGARIDVIDQMELSLAQVIRRYKRADLEFLRERVLTEHPGIGAQWYDDALQQKEEDEEQ
ncbi:ankyrin repeat domain-containing protein [Streptomyces sp. NBC_01013]|uniref:ankyrin repeat domain-containing protein n=1 Tax=Streptomyces sp. NBC_01013 TaxID=2903718 RepID=UPI0038636540|nr:ankyrin repeat domain-containing protein [Streptomyces sp. NBC_01013]